MIVASWVVMLAARGEASEGRDGSIVFVEVDIHVSVSEGEGISCGIGNDEGMSS